MRRRLCVAVFGLLVGLAVPLAAQLTGAAATAKAEAILKNLQDDNTADIVKEFDERMAKAISEAQLKAVWQGMVEKFGAVKSIDERRVGLLKELQAVELMLTFEREKVVQRVVFTNDGRVAGLAFQPANLALLPAAK